MFQADAWSTMARSSSTKSLQPTDYAWVYTCMSYTYVYTYIYARSANSETFTCVLERYTARLSHLHCCVCFNVYMYVCICILQCIEQYTNIRCTSLCMLTWFVCLCVLFFWFELTLACKVFMNAISATVVVVDGGVCVHNNTYTMYFGKRYRDSQQCFLFTCSLCANLYHCIHVCVLRLLLQWLLLVLAVIGLYCWWTCIVKVRDPQSQ